MLSTTDCSQSTHERERDTHTHTCTSKDPHVKSNGQNQHSSHMCPDFAEDCTEKNLPHPLIQMLTCTRMCKRVQICIHAHTYTRTCIHTYLNTKHTCFHHSCIHACTYKYSNPAHTYTHTSIPSKHAFTIHIQIFKPAHAYTHTSIPSIQAFTIHAHMHVHTNIQTPPKGQDRKR